MIFSILKTILLFILVLTFIFSTSFLSMNEKEAIFAQSSSAKERQALEEELRKLEEEISQYEQNIFKTQQEKKTLQNKISILRNKIKKLDLQIYQGNLMIKDLTLQIEDTQDSIEKTTLLIKDSREKLANILRKIYEEDQRSLVEVLLAEGISDFFNNLVALEALNSKNRELLDHIKNLKSHLEEQKKSLDQEKEDLERLVIIQTLQKQESEATKREKEKLLEETKGREEEYQKMLQATQKRAQEIRLRIFELIGIPKAPTFGEAYEIAKFVSAQTGIRPALLLAVLTQESNIGKNVGQCYLVDSKTGQGIRAKTGERISRVMNPKRDIPHFLNICQKLGRDPYNTPVSCPMKYGWGGAMGPAQFIPSTWIKYETKLEKMIGKTPDPWQITDAFLATGIYLRDLGALENEFKATMRYFSGSSWFWWEEFYGKSVLRIAEQYEQDIRELEKVQ